VDSTPIPPDLRWQAAGKLPGPTFWPRLLRGDVFRKNAAMFMLSNAEKYGDLPELFEGLFEDDAGVVVVEIWEPVVADEVDGVVVALLLIAFQAARHESYGASGTHSTPPMRKEGA